MGHVREVEMQAIVLAISQENADAILDGTRTADHRSLPPKRLPARAYLAVVGTGAVVGECVLGAPSAMTAKGWSLPVSRARRYRRPKPLADYGLQKTPRSFRYVAG
jgi:predicted transcriptional regulator